MANDSNFAKESCEPFFIRRETLAMIHVCNTKLTVTPEKCRMDEGSRLA